MSSLIQILHVGGREIDLSTSAWGPFTAQTCASLDAAAQALRDHPHDALVVDTTALRTVDDLLHWTALSHAVLDAALIVVTPEPPSALALRLLACGAQDVLPAREGVGEALARSVRLAVERKRIEQSARKAYATDLATGLPNHAQLREHMTHLLALREREPAPMALLALRVEGLLTAEARLGTESANVLRRKLAVRIRAGLRASDVVAAIGNDAFAVLLAWIDSADDGARVAAKIARSLSQPMAVAGTECAVAVSAGVALYPEHGANADALLQRAVGQAAQLASVGRAGFANRIERGPSPAANDEGPPTFT